MPATARRTSFLTLDTKGRATLPEEVRATLGVRAGDLVLLTKTDHGTYELVPATLVPTDQLWFHHPTMRERIAEAEAHFATGRATRTTSPTAAQALLDSLKRRTPQRAAPRPRAAR
jgi:AbrB family looped-hinge helix DNA binding protein